MKGMQMDKNKLQGYTINEVAQFLKLSPRTIYSYAKSGQLKGYKISRGWRFKEEHIQEFIIRHEMKATKYVK